ncbi:MAG: hypothetical protein SV062_08230 [Thermodesulfobacteriota bacterium]|nr:hypothetical protein [Thermodesulfobacteriota bacterium]
MKEKERQEIINEVREKVERGDRKIYCVLRHVSASGMSRDIDFFIFYAENGKIRKDWLSYDLSQIMGYTYNENRECLRVNGRGMDMGFVVVHHLGEILYPGGDGKTVTGRNGSKEIETDGGYLLKHEWL